MSSPHLCALAREKTILVVDDAIHELGGKGMPQDILLSIRGITTGFAPSLSLVDAENLQLADRMEEALESKKAELLYEEEKLGRDFKSLKTPFHNNEYLAFINTFIDLWRYQEDNKTHSDEELAYKKTAQNPVDASFHAKGAKQKTSAFTSLIRSLPMRCDMRLIIRELCYCPVPDAKADAGSQFLDIMGKKHQIKFDQTLDELEEKYTTALEDSIEARCDAELDAWHEHIMREWARKGDLEKQVNKMRKYEEVGYLFDGKDYYIWMHVPQLETESALKKEKYLFPSCKIGLRLVKHGNKIDFDRNADTGGIRVLEAQSVANGIETGQMQSMKQKEYHFPSATMTASNDYTYICISPEGSRVYLHFEPKPNRSVFFCMKKLLKQAESAMRRGYDETNKSMKVFHPICNTCNTEYFANFRMNSGAKKPGAQ
jgi:hypothetical protein